MDWGFTRRAAIGRMEAERAVSELSRWTGFVSVPWTSSMADEPIEISLTTTNTLLLEGLKKAENRTIWTQFVERYRPVIVGYAQRSGLHGDHAEDAAQETLAAFDKAYREGGYDPNHKNAGLRKWLFTIAHNKITSALRRLYAEEEKRVNPSSSQSDFFARIPDEDHSQQRWDGCWLKAVFDQCLEEVRAKRASKTVDAFELFVRQGWRAKKLAEHLGITENAVFLAKNKILKDIRQLMPNLEEIW